MNNTLSKFLSGYVIFAMVLMSASSLFSLPKIAKATEVENGIHAPVIIHVCHQDNKGDEDSWKDQEINSEDLGKYQDEGGYENNDEHSDDSCKKHHHEHENNNNDDCDIKGDDSEGNDNCDNGNDLAQISAYKILCPSEDLLPNWGNGDGPATITSFTASDFVAKNPTCEIVPWTFEWKTDAPNVDENPGDNVLTGGAGWTTFASTVMVPANQTVWVREQLPEGYQTFSGTTANPADEEVSAEFYCGSDVLNYDNLEYINLESDHSYNCVAFNVLAENNNDGGMCGDQDETTHDIVSDSTTLNEGNATVPVTHIDGSWALIPGATWIWTTDPVTSHVTGETQVFTKTFNVTGPSSDATLEVAADNAYSVTLNGNPLCDHPGGDGFLATQSCNIPAGDLLANNTLTFTVTNNPEPIAQSPYNNPAGLIYKLSFTDCVNNEEPNQCNPEVNLIANGGFETPTTPTWTIFPSGTPLLEWLVAWVGAPSSGTEGLEIQNNVAGAPASGSQHAELDGDHPVKIWQDIATVPGQTYNLNFKYSGRPGVSAADNSILTKIEGAVLGATLADDSTLQSNTVWTPHTRTFVATDSSTKVEFYDNGTDTSLGGYLDDVSLTCSNDNYSCEDDTSTQTFLSAAGTTKKGENSTLEIPMPYHTAWTASIPGAKWVWGEYPTSDTVNDLTETFTQNFTVSGTPTGGTLMIAADNSYSVTLNGNPLCADTAENNYGSADTCAIGAGMLLNGANTMEFTVKNWAMGGGTQATNPAGLMYKLEIGNNQCLPQPVDVCPNIDGNQSELPDGMMYNSDKQCVPVEVLKMCGALLTTDVPNGDQTNPLTYDYVMPSTNANPGDFIDHSWVQANGETRLVWDMGAGTNTAYLIPSIDHGPTPGESHEATLYGSNTPTGPWTPGVESATYPNGPSSWTSDNDSTKWTFGMPYRYISALAGGTIVNDGDAEIDAVCSDFSEAPNNPGTGHIIVYKQTNIETAQTFNFDITGTQNDTFDLQSGEMKDETLPEGIYTVSELLGELPNGWTLDSIQCIYPNEEGSAGIITEDQHGEVVSLEGGETVTCTFHNIYTPTMHNPSADLSITKTVDDNTVTHNQNVTYTLTVTNHGPDTANYVKAYDVLPAGVSYVSKNVSQGTYDENTGAWDIGTLTNGQSVTLTIEVNVEATSGTVTNQSGVFIDAEQNNIDSNSENDTASVDITLQNTNRGGSSGSRPSGNSGSAPQGQVLGAESNICAWNASFLRRNWHGNKMEDVKTVQTFLNQYMLSGLIVDGMFGLKTEAAVKAFQAKYADDILKPWGINSPTGLFYLSTLTKAKEITCATNESLPTLINWSENPTVR